MTSPRKKSVDLSTRIGGITAILIAVGALIAAAKPIYEDLSSLACKAVPNWCGGQPTIISTGLAIGTTGWIYVGTRVGDTWDVTKRENEEPPLTLQTAGIPKEGGVYNVVQSVRLRENSPEPTKDGSRPVMTNQKGVVAPASQVKLDKVVTYDLKSPDATWVFAHVTLISTGNE